MALEKAQYWTDLYYDVVKHYFWRPQDIGRKAPPSPKPRRPGWDHWRNRLRAQEAPLNHMMDFLFHVAPDELLNNTISALLPEPKSGLQLVAPTKGTIDPKIVQPDIILSNEDSLVFVEMKVDSQSSVDQFAKYAIAAHWILKADRSYTSVDLVVLSRYGNHLQVWKDAKKLGLSDGAAVRQLALRGLAGDPGVWKQKGVPRFVRNNPEAVPSLVNHVKSMGLHLSGYEALAGELIAYRAKEGKTVGRLIDGILEEFRRRGLTGPAVRAAAG